MGYTKEDYLIHLADSFMVSADNAHAVHPNYTDKADPVNRPYLNGGIVVKFNANQKYCTDGISAAVFRDICEKAGVPFRLLLIARIWQAVPLWEIYRTPRWLLIQWISDFLNWLCILHMRQQE